MIKAQTHHVCHAASILHHQHSSSICIEFAVRCMLLPLQVFALLSARYMSCWDVRYHTLRTLTRLAQQRAVRADTTAAAAAAAAATAAAAGGGDSDEEDEQAAAVGGGEQQQQMPKAAADVARSMFDVLAAVQPILPQQQRRQQQKGQPEEEEEQEEVPSWCGAAEVSVCGCLCVLAQ
jgi:hypothetical protein